MTRLTADRPLPSEALPLASEMSQAMSRYVDAEMKYLSRSAAEAIASSESLAQARTQRAERGDPSHATFCELAALAKLDPDRSKARWQEIRKAARAELVTGHRAAKADEPAHFESAWERASFLALRDEFVTAWNPQNGIERALIDQMTQAWSGQLFWHERMMLFACIECDNERIKKDQHSKAPRVEDFQAVNQAAEMVDRFNRVFMRTLRTLKDMRRHPPTLVVQNVGQMNVAEQQVNVA